MKSGNLNFLEPSGQLGPVLGLYPYLLSVKGFLVTDSMKEETHVCHKKSTLPY